MKLEALAGKRRSSRLEALVSKRRSPRRMIRTRTRTKTSTVRPTVDLPEEVIFNILLLLPGKSLMRFKSVSKPWLTLLSSPHFIKSHLNHSVKNPKHVLTAPKSSSILSINFETSINKTLILRPNLPQKQIFDVVGSCNGFFCLTDYRKFIALWNPATQEYLTLPAKPKYIFSHDISSTHIGFGYNANTDEYEVVTFVHFIYFAREHRQFKDVNVYTVRTKSWRKIVGDIPSIMDGMVVHLKGVMYWLNRRDIQRQKDTSVGSFSVGSEELGKEFACPISFCEKDVVILGVLCGYLSFTYQDESRVGSAEIWLMTESSWAKFYTLDWKQHPRCGPIEPIMLRKNKELVLKGGRNGVVVYDQDTDVYKYYEIENIGQWNMSFIYVETIISLASPMDFIGGRWKRRKGSANQRKQ